MTDGLFGTHRELEIAANAARAMGISVAEATEAIHSLCRIPAGTMVSLGDDLLRRIPVGMYTAIVMELTLRGEVLEFFDWWARWPRGKCPGFPDHELFDLCRAGVKDPSSTGGRWYMLLWSDDMGARFGDGPGPRYERRGDVATIRSSSSLKNYCGSIEQFQDFITPFAREGYVVQRYEESDDWHGFVYAEGKRRPVSLPGSQWD